MVLLPFNCWRDTGIRLQSPKITNIVLIQDTSACKQKYIFIAVPHQDFARVSPASAPKPDIRCACYIVHSHFVMDHAARGFPRGSFGTGMFMNPIPEKDEELCMYLATYCVKKQYMYQENLSL